MSVRPLTPLALPSRRANAARSTGPRWLQPEPRVKHGIRMKLECPLNSVGYADCLWLPSPASNCDRLGRGIHGWGREAGRAVVVPGVEPRPAIAREAVDDEGRVACCRMSAGVERRSALVFIQSNGALPVLPSLLAGVTRRHWRTASLTCPICKKRKANRFCPAKAHRLPVGLSASGGEPPV